MGGQAQARVVLRLSGITKRFGPLVANDAITFDLHEGEVIALLGENGAGKTTLMNILFGHYSADEGAVELFGAPLAPGNPRAALAAGTALALLGAKRMVVGHTVMEGGIAPACGGAVLRIDVGLSAAYGGAAEALEIVGDTVRALGVDGPRDLETPP